MPRIIRDIPIKGFKNELETAVSSPATVANRRSINLYRGYDEILLRNVHATIDGAFGLVPAIRYVVFLDDSAGTYTVIAGPQSEMFARGEANTIQFLLGSATDRLFVGTTDRVGGYRLDLDASLVNNNNQALTAHHSSSTGWTAVTITDGTNSTGTLAQDGNITFDTVPTAAAWGSMKLSDLEDRVPKGFAGDQKLHWIRFQAAAILDTVEIEQMSSLLVVAADDTADSDVMTVRFAGEYTIDVDTSYIGSMEYFSRHDTTDITMDITQIKH